MKAVFLYNFTKYIDWDKIGNEFIIGVIGSSPVEEALAEIARKNKIKDRNIVIRHFEIPEDIRFCHILFIAKNCSFPLASILQETGKGVLTVSEENGYGNQGAAF